MNEPLRKTMCATCPFRPRSPYAYLAEDLAAKAISESSRICHSTGANNAINHRTGIKPHICRGARDVQLTVMASFGVIEEPTEEPTDEAWNAQRVKIGLKPTLVKDPEPKKKRVQEPS